MTRKIYDLTGEPGDDLYRALIDESIKRCDTILLVVRNWKLQPSFAGLLDELVPFLKNKGLKREWPGTELVVGPGRVAIVYIYALTTESATILKQATNALYDWLEPNLPEDLCLLRPDKGAWLVSISHERDSYLQLTPEERKLMRSEMPDLDSVLKG